jgi:integrase
VDAVAPRRGQHRGEERRAHALPRAAPVDDAAARLGQPTRRADVGQRHGPSRRRTGRRGRRLPAGVRDAVRCRPRGIPGVLAVPAHRPAEGGETGGRWFTRDECDRVQLALSARTLRRGEAVVPDPLAGQWQAYVALGCFSRLRCPGELAGLDVRHVDFERRQVHVRQVLTRQATKAYPTTESSNRWAPFRDEVGKLLWGLLTDRPSGPVFLSPTGRPAGGSTRRTCGTGVWRRGRCRCTRTWARVGTTTCTPRGSVAHQWRTPSRKRAPVRLDGGSDLHLLGWAILGSNQ